MTISQSPRKPLIKYLPYLVVLALLVVAAWYFTRPAPPVVQLVKVERGTVTATVSNTRAGTVKACHRAKLSAPSGGQIAKLLVSKGERVKRGQVLLELWNNDLQAQEQLTQRQLDMTQEQTRQACIQADLTEKEAVRARQLQSQGFISIEALEQRNSAAKVAHAGCAAARSQIAQSQSRIAAARAGLDRLVLKAPFDGIVADISGEQGEYATPSPPGIPTPPAIDLIDDRCLFVSAPIDEVDAANIKAGQEAHITLDAIKGKTFAGKVKRVAPYVLELEKQARTVEVEVDFIEPPTAENLLVGYSADVEIIHTRHENVLRIPTQSLLPSESAQNAKRVLLYRNDGVLEERTVSTGLANWEQTEITSGLKEGDQILLSLDNAEAKAGVKVQPETVKSSK